jgi:diguanylate cyclase
LALRTIVSDDADRAFRQLVAHADIAMYEAKRRGGNQTRHHELSV